MRFPWDDEAERADAVRRACTRAGRRGVGAALHRRIARDAGEPFLGIFLVAGRSGMQDLLVEFPDWPSLCEAAARGESRWVLERAVEDELLTRGHRSSDALERLAGPGGSTLVVRPLRSPRR